MIIKEWREGKEERVSAGGGTNRGYGKRERRGGREIWGRWLTQLTRLQKNRAKASRHSSPLSLDPARSRGEQKKKEKRREAVKSHACRR